MSNSKIILLGILITIGSIILIIGLVFGIGFLTVKTKQTFQPMLEDVEREVFENTKSYIQGKLMDLAKYFEEYQEADNKEAISNLIKMNFSYFDETKIANSKLRNFLIEIRGF